ncbi:hypothetical protein BTO05_06685 [Winogradskyella sp. PC-19]|uniref:transglutaminase domain-containing protein n=1 Tax=unclassified Winogradskyella TaxID=2615021 RepID=UPI000B3D3F36|nr:MULTISPECIES: transglutaminase domain-containing protein [unclassified Winogradskyella]ARV09337.1 hypothetical protein BTO05_06685 [Winogradskyella sp. PC-19]RZN83151.1 MAG: DUF3857 domain-containing protein [Winogradskyella sp.]
MKKILALITLVVSVSFGQAQDFKFGKVSKEELQENVHPIDSSANAAVLSKKEDVYFIFTNYDGFMQHREVTERIKIYNKEGYDWATKKIYLYEGSSGATKEKVSSVKGYTYNLKGDKVEKTKLKKDGIFEEDINDYTEVNTITMPNVQDGCVIEYTYKIVSPFIAIDDFTFQYDIPINKLDVKIITPQFYRYNKFNNTKASYFPRIKESREKKTLPTKKASFLGTSATENTSTYNNSNNSYYQDVLTISESNVPALKAEAFAGSMNNYVSKMSMELAAILNEYGSETKSFSSTWEGVSKTINKLASFGGQLKRTNFFEDDITSVTASAENDFQKAAILSAFVKSKVKWNGYYGVSAYKGTKDAYKEGEGNVADINLLLIAMLKSQGVEANPVLVSTRNNGIPLYPTQKGFNYVICMVEDQGKYILLDASERFSSVNVLPERALNWQGRLIKDDGSSSWVSLMSSQQSLESTSLNVKMAEDLSVSGKVRQIVKSNMSLSYKKKYIGLSKDDQVKAIERNKGAIEVSNLELEDKDGNTFSGSYDYVLNDAVEDIGGKLYFSPLLFLAEKENPFKLDERQYPIDFSVPLKQKNIVNIMLPEGYQVESLPQSEVMEFAGGKIKYSFILKENGNFIQLSTEFDLQTPFVGSADYVVFKEFFGKVVAKQAEQIVLSK